MIDHAEIFKPFTALCSISGLIPFKARERISGTAQGSFSREVKLFSAGQLLYSTLWLLVPPILSALVFLKLVDGGLARSGTGNLEGIVLGIGTLTGLFITVGVGSSITNLSHDYIQLIQKLDRKASHMKVLNCFNERDIKKIHRTAWKIVAWYALSLPVCAAQTVLITIKTVGRSFYRSGNALVDVSVALGTLLNFVSPILMISGFAALSVMAAQMTTVKVEALKEFLKRRLQLIPNKQENGGNDPRSNTSRSPDGGEPAEHAELPSWRTSNTVDGSPVGALEELESTLAVFKAELHSVEQDHREITELTKKCDIQGTTATVAFMVFALYYMWTSMDRVIRSREDVCSWLLLGNNVLLATCGLNILWIQCQIGYQLQEQVRSVVRLLRMNQRPDLPRKSIMMMEQICQTLTAAPLKYGVASFFTFDRQTYATMCATIVANLIVLVQFKGGQVGETGVLGRASNTSFTD